MSAARKQKGPASVGALPDHGSNHSRLGKAMNNAASTTSSALIASINAASTAANNHADLIAFVARTAEGYAFNADPETYQKFHAIRMALDGAELLMRENAEALEIISGQIN